MRHLLREICLIAITFVSSLAWSNPKLFTDEDLARLEKSKQGALIYVWSPNQIYSMNGWRQYQAEAHRQKLKFIVVSKLEPKFSEELQIHRLPSFLFLRMNASARIVKTGATIHTPSVLIVNNGKLNPSPIVGRMNGRSLASAIVRRRSK